MVPDGSGLANVDSVLAGLFATLWLGVYSEVRFHLEPVCLIQNAVIQY